ncbi:MAG: class C sortase [Lachnospiraceae bacterium]|nr:class C sortase [Lachnospiraceae bacterium]
MGKKAKTQAERGKKRKGPSISTILLVVILLAGISVMLYPSVSDWWNSMHSTQAIANYVGTVEDMTKEEKERIFDAARAYNESLAPGIHFNLTEAEYAEYEKVLDITSNGIMGYIQIPSIDVNLPIYHGTEESVLQIAVGHIAGSSLPVGGRGTHCILSGHRGLPSAKLFTDLDKLGEGDIFTLTVLDQTITYKVDQIRIVLPEEVDELSIVKKRDYCTLVTCTPYGINTHRILLRGRRIKNLSGDVTVTADASRIPSYIVVPAVGIPMLFLILAAMLIYYRRKKPGKSHQEILAEMKKGAAQKDEPKNSGS